MMSKKQWFVLLCVYVIYLLLGASVFHEVESTKEKREQLEEKKERTIIEELLVQHYVPNEEHTQDEIFEKLTSYCGKPLNANMSEIEHPIRWDFYHSLFFVITVVSTIGYGNLAPTTTVTRIFMIFYAIVGMPMNGMLIINLGDYFGKSFLKLYDRWKTTRVQHALATLGLVGQVVLYLIPGFTFFIFIPSILIMVYEDWPYDVAVHYAFVTLTTIGFGDWVAGTQENGHGEALYMVYKIFLLVWIISGLGYIFMVMGFVASGMRSKRLCAIEHKLAINIKRTNNKIRDELRSMVNEYLLMRVKRVYREKFIYIPHKHNRSQSCPDLKMYSCPDSPMMIARKRAFSTCEDRTSEAEMTRIQSDSDLERIDKERTFNPSNAMIEPGQLLLKVASALGNYDPMDSCSSTAIGSRSKGIDMFSSQEIMASERKGSGWSLGSQKISAIPQRIMRPRAASESKTTHQETVGYYNNNDLTWYGPAATKRLRELREQAKYERVQVKTLPAFTPSTKPSTLFERIKKSFKPNKDNEETRNIDLEAQNYYSAPNSRSGSCTEVDNNYTRLQEETSQTSFEMPNEQLLEETSIADFLRALTALSVPEIPERGYNTSTPPTQTPKRKRRSPIQSFSRRTSLVQFSEPPPKSQNRRFSLRPNLTGAQPPPPPYSPSDSNKPTRTRTFSLRSIKHSSSSISLQRNVLKLKYPIGKDVNFKEPDNKGGGSSNA